MTAAPAPGKSTLVDILLGLIEPGAGEVRIDGRRLAGSDLRRWRRSVAYVPQDPYLFHDTIGANLRWARPEATEAELWEALRLAAAADFVAALPEGLGTVAGDRGARLSGGERQRIVLARALLREHALLLLDEATGQLDAATEERIVAALRSLRGRTTIVAVAHRPALMEAADRIVVLESGRVAAAGDWRALGPRLTGSGRRMTGVRRTRAAAARKVRRPKSRTVRERLRRVSARETCPRAYRAPPFKTGGVALVTARGRRHGDRREGVCPDSRATSRP